MTNIQDIDPVEFLKDYLGIELLHYQKEILRKIWRTDKIYIYPWQDLDRTDIRAMDESIKCLLIKEEK